MLVGVHMREKVPELEWIWSLQEPVLLLKARGLLQAGSNYMLANPMCQELLQRYYSER